MFPSSFRLKTILYLLFSGAEDKKRERYGGGGGVLSDVEGCHVSPSMAPMRPNRKPMKKPPAAPNQLMMENISANIDPVLTLLA